MDQANLALAQRLVEFGHPVCLVAHEVSDDLAHTPGVQTITVPRPAGSILLGESRLARRAHQVALQVKATNPGAIVVGNGGNCFSADINWVHYVHHASRFEDSNSPAGLKLKNRIAERIFQRHEKRGIRKAKLVIANSEMTRRHVVDLLGVAPERVRTIYLGANADWTPPSPEERTAARSWLNVSVDVPVVSFVGALGHDERKGFDTLWNAWRELSVDPTWMAHLFVAGGGRQVERWRHLAAQPGTRIHVLGFTNRVLDLLAASDLLVSPARYEPFGLNVLEAICRGVPAIVSADAGVAELYPAELQQHLLPDPRDHRTLANMLKHWSKNIESARPGFIRLGESLRRRSWQSMADDIIAAAEDITTSNDTLVASR
jgi:glycosyltransferase involved in cell wall biosynthesis